VGSLLLIDEAYAMLPTSGSYGREAIDTLVSSLTEDSFRGRLVVILAGYEADMQALLGANEGMRSRFAKTVLQFPAWDANTSSAAFTAAAKRGGIGLTPAAEARLPGMFEPLMARTGWSNGRDVDTLYSKAYAKRALRLTAAAKAAAATKTSAATGDAGAGGLSRASSSASRDGMPAGAPSLTRDASSTSGDVSKPGRLARNPSSASGTSGGPASPAPHVPAPYEVSDLEAAFAEMLASRPEAAAGAGMGAYGGAGGLSGRDQLAALLAGAGAGAGAGVAAPGGVMGGGSGRLMDDAVGGPGGRAPASVAPGSGAGKLPADSTARAAGSDVAENGRTGEAGAGAGSAAGASGGHTHTGACGAGCSDGSNGTAPAEAAALYKPKQAQKVKQLMQRADGTVEPEEEPPGESWLIQALASAAAMTGLSLTLEDMLAMAQGTKPWPQSMLVDLAARFGWDPSEVAAKVAEQAREDVPQLKAAVRLAQRLQEAEESLPEEERLSRIKLYVCGICRQPGCPLAPTEIGGVYISVPRGQAPPGSMMATAAQIAKFT
jgi:hypothetical protein